MLSEGLEDEIEKHGKRKMKSCEGYFKCKSIEEIMELEQLQDPLLIEMFKKLIIAANNYLTTHVKYLK